MEINNYENMPSKAGLSARSTDLVACNVVRILNDNQAMPIFLQEDGMMKINILNYFLCKQHIDTDFSWSPYNDFIAYLRDNETIVCVKDFEAEIMKLARAFTHSESFPKNSYMRADQDFLSWIQMESQDAGPVIGAKIRSYLQLVRDLPLYNSRGYIVELVQLSDNDWVISLENLKESLKSLYIQSSDKSSHQFIHELFDSWFMDTDINLLVELYKSL